MDNKILIVSICTNEILQDNINTIINKQFYCNKWGITFTNLTERLSKRHAQWDKIKAVLKFLPFYDYVIWMDADAIFNNLDIDFRKYITDNLEKELIICGDPCEFAGDHCYINTGIFITKNAPNSFKLLNAVWNSIDDYNVENLDKFSYDGYPHEQGALAKCLLSDEYKKYHYKYDHINHFNVHPNFSNNETFIIHYMGSRGNKEKIQEYISKCANINTKLNINLSISEANFFINKKHNICISTLATNNLEYYSKITNENKYKYCKLYQNISFEFTDTKLSTRHPAWDKIQYVLQLMKDNKYDYIMWVDADACINNKDIDITDLINVYPNINLFICRDPIFEVPLVNHKLPSDLDINKLSNLRIINSGVFIVKNNEIMKNFLEKVWETKTKTNNGMSNFEVEISLENTGYLHSYLDWPYEQGSITANMISRNDYEIFPTHSFNTHNNNINDYNFICHAMGINTQNKDNKLKTMEFFNNINNRVFKTINVVVSKDNVNTEFVTKLENLKKYNINILVNSNNSNNLGNEAVVYLKYIIDNYYNLTDFTFFICDEYSDKYKGCITDRFLEALNSKKLFFNINNIYLNGFSSIREKEELMEWYNKFIEPYIPFDKLPNQDWLIGYKACSQFLVHKSVITHLPYKFYNDIYNWILEFDSKLSKYFLEWTWHLFWDISPSCKIYNS